MASTRMYILAIVVIIVITALIIISLNNGRVVPEQTGEQLDEAYASAPDYAIQRIFQDTGTPPDRRGEKQEYQ